MTATPPISDPFSSWTYNTRYIIKGTIPTGKSCYIRGGCVSLYIFDVTDYESALRFSENCLVLGKIHLKF